MKHNLKTFPHRKGFGKDFLKTKDACEWVDATIRCPEYHKWLENFEKEIRAKIVYWKQLTKEKKLDTFSLRFFAQEILGEASPREGSRGG